MRFERGTEAFSKQIRIFSKSFQQEFRSFTADYSYIALTLSSQAIKPAKEILDYFRNEHLFTTRYSLFCGVYTLVLHERKQTVASKGNIYFGTWMGHKPFCERTMIGFWLISVLSPVQLIQMYHVYYHLTEKDMKWQAINSCRSNSIGYKIKLG